jgi:integrase
MKVNRRGSSWEVAVYDADADKGHTRHRYSRKTEADARSLGTEIEAALCQFGHWPLTATSKPKAPKIYNVLRSGTLREASHHAITTHWVGTSWGDTVDRVVPSMLEFFEKRSRKNIDSITSEDLDAYVSECRARGNTATTINKKLSILSVINTVALERRPQLANIRLPIKRVPAKHVEKWWIRPEDLDRLVNWLLTVKGDPVFADLVLTIVLQGLRVSEALRQERRHVIGLSGDTPKLMVAGEKTSLSEAAIPIFTHSIGVYQRSVERAVNMGWKRLFPLSWRQASDRWNECRVYLGVEHIPSSTMRALRRTTAAYANKAGMTTRLLQKILRHETITTTEGYLRLIGAEELEDARRYM